MQTPATNASRPRTGRGSVFVTRVLSDTRRRVPDLPHAVGTMALTFAFVVGIMRLWHADLAVPLNYSGDANAYGMAVKDVLEHGWHLVNPSLGAPFGQDLHDFPAFGGDNLQFLVIKALGLFTGNAIVVLNLFFLLSFPLTALTAFIVFRRFGISAWVAVVCSTLFALLPFHFVRGEGHLFLATYYAVPLGAYLVLAVLDDRRLFVRRRGSGPKALAYATWESALAVALCVVIGSASGGGYFAVFTILLLAAAGALAFIARRNAAALLTAVMLIAAIGGVLVLNLAPNIAYKLTHDGGGAGVRLPSESEVYSLKIANLVLPIDEHRLKPLAKLEQKYATTTPLPSEGAAAHLGIVGTVGFLWLLGFALARAVGAVGSGWGRLHGYCAAALLVALLVATTGGFSALIGYLLTPQIRAWSRMSVVIGFFSLLAVALLLDLLSRRVHRGRAGFAFPAVLAATLLVGVFDQTSNAFVPAYAANQASFRSDEEFVRQIEERLPAGADVYQLPYVPFPESPPVQRMTDYDELKGYLHSTDLSWSYGILKGSAEDWQPEILDEPVSLLLPALAAAGFEGIYVDRFGYADSGKALEGQLRQIVREAPLVSPDGRLSFFDLQAYEASVRAAHATGEIAALRTAALEPLRAEWGTGFGSLEQDAKHSWRWADRRAELTLENPSETARDVILKAELVSGTKLQGTVTVQQPDGSISESMATPDGTPVELRIELAPGTNRVLLSSDLPRVPAPEDPRALYFRLVDIELVDAAFAPFE